MLEELKIALSAKGVAKAKILSGSMEPVIQTGDLVDVRPIEDRSVLKPFDLVVFQSENRLMCHYMVGWSRFSEREPVMITRGLANTFVDFPVSWNSVLGVVTERRIPFWLKIREYLRSAGGWGR